jgi:hypothetical protein
MTMKVKEPKPKILELNASQLEVLRERIKANQLREEDCAIVRALIDSYVYVLALLNNTKTTLHRLRNIIFGARSEKTDSVFGKGKDAQDPSSPAKDDQTKSTPENVSHPSRKGHGRNGAAAYRGAEKIWVPHASLQPGDPCTNCPRGTVYEMDRSGVLVRIVGQAPIQATVYELQKLRCGLCGKVFTAQTPEGVGSEKYDATAGSIMALLTYGIGLPFNRVQGLQGSLGIPLPASTQWDIVEDVAKRIEPAHEELIRQAAQGDVLYNDDTTVKILELMGKRGKPEGFPEDSAEGPAQKTRRKKASERRGMFTSGIVSTHEGRRIALFFSGRKHAGENLADVLAHRDGTRGPPIQMCDALSRNLPAALETIVAHCLAHGRRKFVDVADCFPTECLHVLEALKVIYKNDEIARERDLSPEARLQFHQAESGPVMESLQAWLNRQLDDRLVEPNSALGDAISYLLKYWKRLTLFLRKPGAPLDNNICERALKKAILHRKNSMFYKTEHGAHVGDIFMSLIYTCELCGANPFDYLTELQRHAVQLASNPENWMPWNYRQTLESTATVPDTAH